MTYPPPNFADPTFPGDLGADDLDSLLRARDSIPSWHFGPPQDSLEKVSQQPIQRFISETEGQFLSAASSRSFQQHHPSSSRMPLPVEDFDIGSQEPPYELGVDKQNRETSHQNLATQDTRKQAPLSPRPGSIHIPFLDRLRAIPEVRVIPWRPGQELPLERSINSPRVQQRGATLLSTRGAVAPSPCEHCAAGYGRFSQCVILEHWFQGACSGCIFTSKGNKCSLRFQKSGESARTPKPSQQPMQIFLAAPERQLFSQPSGLNHGGYPSYNYSIDDGFRTPVNDRAFGSSSNNGGPQEHGNFHQLITAFPDIDPVGDIDNIGGILNDSTSPIGLNDLPDVDTDGDFDIDDIVVETGSESDYTPKSKRTRKRMSGTNKGVHPTSKRSRPSKVGVHQCKSCDHAPFKDAGALQRHTANAHTRAFICVFAFAGCPSTFASKNEWKRHVSSEHLNLSSWVCELQACSKVLLIPKTGGLPRTGSEFNRKDLFTQHLRRMHTPFAVKRMQKKNLEWEEKLKELATSCLKVKRLPPTRLICPLSSCGTVFEGQSCWDDRMEHVGKHLEKAAASTGQYYEVRQEDDKLLVEWALREGIVESRPAENGYRLCIGGRDRVEDEDAEGEEEPMEDYTDLHRNTKIERTPQHQPAKELEIQHDLTENRISMARDAHMIRIEDAKPLEPEKRETSKTLRHFDNSGSNLPLPLPTAPVLGPSILDMNSEFTLELYSQILLFKNNRSQDVLVFPSPDKAKQQILQSLAHNLDLECEYALATRSLKISRPTPEDRFLGGGSSNHFQYDLFNIPPNGLELGRGWEELPSTHIGKALSFFQQSQPDIRRTMDKTVAVAEAVQGTGMEHSDVKGPSAMDSSYAHPDVQPIPSSSTDPDSSVQSPTNYAPTGSRRKFTTDVSDPHSVIGDGQSDVGTQNCSMEESRETGKENRENPGTITIDDRQTDSGYHTGLGTDTASVISCDSSEAWPGLSLGLLHDIITNFTDILLDSPFVADWASAAAMVIPSHTMETKVAGLLKNFSSELLPLASVDQDSKKKIEACIFIRRNKNRIARCFRENASTAATAGVFDQLRSSNMEISLEEKMNNWKLASKIVKKQGDEDSDGDDDELPIEFSAVKEFLISSPPFQRLLERFQAVYYDRDEKLSTIQTLLSSHLLPSGSLHHVATLEMDLDLPTFMRSQYTVDKNVNLESVITISGSALYCQATTSAEYLRQNWPDYGCEMLQALQAALDSPQLIAKGLLMVLT